LEALNRAFDPALGRFRVLARFELAPKPGVMNAARLQDFTATLATNGTFALFEFTGALPRAKLYSGWETFADDAGAVAGLSTNLLSLSDLEYLKALRTNDFLARSNSAWLQAELTLKTIGTNDFLTLRQLASPSFDPLQTVLLADTPAKLKSSSGNNGNPGTVEFVSYDPRRIVLRAKSTGPSVLLLNDKFDPSWKVTVDGKPEKLLRCNYIMRGVEVADGEHTVEFRFEPPIKGLYISLAAIVVGLAITGILIFPARSKPVGDEQKPSRQASPVAKQNEPFAAKQRK
jgi:hypothetical protein